MGQDPVRPAGTQDGRLRSIVPTAQLVGCILLSPLKEGRHAIQHPHQRPGCQSHWNPQSTQLGLSVISLWTPGTQAHAQPGVQHALRMF